MRFVLITSAFTCILVVVILALSFRLKSLGIGGIGGIGILVFLFIIVRLAMDYMEAEAKRMMREEGRAIRGAKAEEKIGSYLDTLGEDYLIIHDVESPYGNIDHIVIGKRSGVFLIETKAHGGRVSVVNGQLLVNGHKPEKDFIAQALRNTYWLREKIREAIHMEVWIMPIVVFANAFVERTPPVKGVTIINKKYLLSVLQKANPKAQNLFVWENREKILEALRDPGRDSPSVAGRPARAPRDPFTQNRDEGPIHEKATGRDERGSWAGGAGAKPIPD